MQFRKLEKPYSAFLIGTKDAAEEAKLVEFLTAKTAPAPTPDPTPAPAPKQTIVAADIVYFANQDVPFAQQSGYWAAAYGKDVRINTLGEEGITGSLLSNGETVRIGKVADPTNPARKALAFQLGVGDPITQGNHRCELEFDKKLQYDKVYWIAFRAYVYDWGTLPAGDEALFGLQFHDGDTDKGFNPSVSLVVYGARSGGRAFHVFVSYSTDSAPSTENDKGWHSADIPLPFGRWIDFVFKVKENIQSGLAQVWMDGKQICDYTGPVGFLTQGFNSYVKHGYYNWSDYKTPRKVLLRSPVTVADPTGSKYKPEDLRAFINP
jgi:hypothetical protein